MTVFDYCYLGGTTTSSPSLAPSVGPLTPTGPTPGLIEGEELACIAMAKAFPQLQTLAGNTVTVATLIIYPFA